MEDVTVEVIRRYVKYHSKNRSEIFDMLAIEAADVLKAELVLICECFSCPKVVNPAFEESGSFSDFSDVEEQMEVKNNIELHTLGTYASNKEAIRKFRENLSRKTDHEKQEKGWIRVHRDRAKIFGKLCSGERIFMTETESKHINDILPEEHPHVRNVVGIPLCNLESEKEDPKCSKGLGVLVASNFPSELAQQEAFERLRNLADLLRMTLSGYEQRRMRSVFASVVDNIQTPIIVFQKRASVSETVVINDDEKLENLADFRCLIHNRAFTQNVLTGSCKNLVGTALFQSFPQLFHTEEILGRLISVVYDTTECRSSILEAIEYEDLLVEKNVYTIKFCKIDCRTFIMSVDNVSDQLRAKMLAEEIAQAKEQFVANVSHEIRTPLNGILGYIAMMSDPKEIATLTEYQKNCFSQIKDCSMNLLYIMNDILDFSKLNADQMQLKDAPFDLTELLEKSYDVILPGAHEKGIEGAFLIDPNVPPRVKGDFKKLRQVLLNLLSNGVKFTHRGRVDTTVKLVKDEATDSDLDIRGRYTLEFCVQDTGIGISPRNQQKLFRAFSQIDQSNKKIYQGTGLGLVISKKLVELMGGKIWIESEEGEGSSFYFTVKLEEARATSTETQQKWLPLLKDRNVLVVDDHATNRITIASHLVQWGMKPLVCGSAEEALLYLRGGVMNFDFALIDMRMPKMDGNELAKKIVQLVPTLPLVAISSAPLGPREINKSFIHYISKPIKHRQLFNICVSIIKRIKAKNPSSPLLPAPAPAPEEPSNPLDLLRPEPCISSPDFAFPEITVDPEVATKYPHIYSMPSPCKNLNRSILIAEDLYTNQRVAIGFLEKLGFSDFTVAEDGEEALCAVRERDFDVILMDLKMPKLDGYETTRRLRQFYKTQRRNKKQPFIIALTANAMGGVRERCAEAGMDAYVTKPIDMTELANVLNLNE